ncbi:MAG: S-layer homology domain-containing protein, partial [Rivularia sp. (in: cyanobacteria)]
VAVRVHPQASLIAEWTGQDLAVGASIAPFKRIPLVITPAVRDIAGPGAGASDGARFVLGVGLGFRL